jgi:hypothetical protein
VIAVRAPVERPNVLEDARFEALRRGGEGRGHAQRRHDDISKVIERVFRVADAPSTPRRPPAGCFYRASKRMSEKGVSV